MSKKASIIILSIVAAVFLCLAVFAFLPKAVSLGAYREYYSPLMTVQRGMDVGDITQASYKIEADDVEAAQLDAQKAQALKTLHNRFAKVYGYYNTKLNYDQNGDLIVAIPSTTSPANDAVTADSIISAMMVRGKLEILSSTTYAEDSVTLDLSDTTLFKRASVNEYVSGSSRFHIARIELTKEGVALAKEKLTVTSNNYNNYLAVDGTVSYGVYYTLGADSLQVYTSSNRDAKFIASIINDGELPFAVSQIEIDDIEHGSALMTILTIAMLVLIVAVAAYFFIKYKTLGLAYGLSLLISVVAVMYFAGGAYFTMFNVASFIGFLLGLAASTYVAMVMFNNVSEALASGRTGGFAISSAYGKTWLKALIALGGALVLSIVMFVIPTAFTVSFGNALLYATISAAVANFGLNALFAWMLAR